MYWGSKQRGQLSVDDATAAAISLADLSACTNQTNQERNLSIMRPSVKPGLLYLPDGLAGPLTHYLAAHLIYSYVSDFITATSISLVLFFTGGYFTAVFKTWLECLSSIHWFLGQSHFDRLRFGSFWTQVHKLVRLCISNLKLCCKFPCNEYSL